MTLQDLLKAAKNSSNKNIVSVSEIFTNHNFVEVFEISTTNNTLTVLDAFGLFCIIDENINAEFTIETIDEFEPTLKNFKL